MSGSSNWSRIVSFQGTDTGSFPVPGTVVVAQLEERWIVAPNVTGSSPVYHLGE